MLTDEIKIFKNLEQIIFLFVNVRQEQQSFIHLIFILLLLNLFTFTHQKDKHPPPFDDHLNYADSNHPQILYFALELLNILFNIFYDIILLIHKSQIFNQHFYNL